MGLLIGNISNTILPDSVKTALNETVPMYGVKFSSTSTVGTRTYDAAVLNWTRSNNTTAGIDNFQSIAPFRVKECCRVWDNTNKVATYYYKDNYTASEWATVRNGTHATIIGDIMIEFAEFWYRRVQTTDGLEIIVAPAYKVGFTPDPWHYVKGVHTDKRYIFKYNTSSGYNSLSGKATLASTNMNTLRTGFQSKGLNILSAQAYYSIALLMLVKYANTDLQATVSMGINSGNTSVSSGGADNILGVDGSATVISANESVLTMGIENFCGNVWKYLDGIFGYNGNLYIKDVEDMATDPSSTSDLSTYTKIESTYANGADNTLITTIANDNVYDWSLFPANSANKKTIVCNDNWWSAYTLDCVIVGGAGWHGSSDGLFAFYVSGAVGYAYANVGSLAVC